MHSPVRRRSLLVPDGRGALQALGERVRATAHSEHREPSEIGAA